MNIVNSGALQDADLWRWAIPESKAFHSGFCSLGLEMDANVNPGIWQQLLQLSPADVIERVSSPKKVLQNFEGLGFRVLSRSLQVGLHSQRQGVATMADAVQRACSQLSAVCISCAGDT